MAYRGKEIVNPATRQRVVFLQTARDTGGNLLEMEAIYLAGFRPDYEEYID